MLKLNDDKREALFIASLHFQKSLERDACLSVDTNICFTITISEDLNIGEFRVSLPIHNVAATYLSALLNL